MRRTTTTHICDVFLTQYKHNIHLSPGSPLCTNDPQIRYVHSPLTITKY